MPCQIFRWNMAHRAPFRWRRNMFLAPVRGPSSSECSLHVSNRPDQTAACQFHCPSLTRLICASFCLLSLPESQAVFLVPVGVGRRIGMLASIFAPSVMEGRSCVVIDQLCMWNYRHAIAHTQPVFPHHQVGNRGHTTWFMPLKGT